MEIIDGYHFYGIIDRTIFQVASGVDVIKSRCESVFKKIVGHCFHSFLLSHVNKAQSEARK